MFAAVREIVRKTTQLIAGKDGFWWGALALYRDAAPLDRVVRNDQSPIAGTVGHGTMRSFACDDMMSCLGDICYQQWLHGLVHAYLNCIQSTNSLKHCCRVCVNDRQKVCKPKIPASGCQNVLGCRAANASPRAVRQGTARCVGADFSICTSTEMRIHNPISTPAADIQQPPESWTDRAWV
jgi:hypothetical protein